MDEFKRLSAKCLDIVRDKDTGTLQCDIYLNDDQSECLVIERYRNSEALIEHLEHIGEDLTAAVPATAASVNGETLGEPSAELQARLAGSDVRLFTPFLSMRH